MHLYVSNDSVNWIDSSGLVTVLITSYSTYAGIMVGNHSAVYVNTPGKEPVIYDPAGGYVPISTGHRENHGICYGDQANLADYRDYHTKQGDVIEFTILPTTPEQEDEILKAADRLKDPVGPFCATFISEALNGACGIEGSRRPGVLNEQAKSARCP